MDKVEEQGCSIIDTTCGDVMKVWRRVRNYAKEGVTSIIHGKTGHEETRATASRACGVDGSGSFLIVLTLEEVAIVCDYIRNGGDSSAFLENFSNSVSEGFDPDIHLKKIGVANQTTMLKSETEEIQRRIEASMIERDGNADNLQVFDTICGATQERQDALFEMLEHPLDMLIVVGGYNSSNTTHLVEIGEKELPTFFIHSSDCLTSLEEILHFDIHNREEVTTYTDTLSGKEKVTIGVTAGASCPNNLIENTILKVFELRGVSEDEVRGV